MVNGFLAIVICVSTFAQSCLFDELLPHHLIQTTIETSAFIPSVVLVAESNLSQTVDGPSFAQRAAWFFTILFFAASSLVLLLLYFHEKRNANQYANRLLKLNNEIHSESSLLAKRLLQLPVMLVAFDSSGKIIAWSSECQRITGFSKDELSGGCTDLYKHLSEEQRSRIQDSQALINLSKWELVSKSGLQRTIVWRRLTESVSVSEWHEWGIGYEVTPSDFDQKEATQQELYYRDAIELGDSVPYYMNYLTNRYDFVGEQITGLTGYYPDEFTPSLWQSRVKEVILLGPLAGMSLDEAVECARNQDGRSWRADFRILTKNGEERWLANAAVQVRDAQDNIIGSTGILQDITERKQAEKALRESEARYWSIVEDQAEFIVRWKPDYTIVYANDAYCRYFDRSRKELLGFNFLKFIPESDRADVINKIQTLTPAEPSKIDEHRAFCPDGSMSWVSWTDYAIFDNQGQVMEYQSVGRDITQRKIAELALQKSQERLELALHGANLGIWDYNFKTGLIYINERWANLMGYSASELPSSIRTWRRLVHPDDRRRVLRAWAAHLRGLFSSYQAEYRLCSKNGEWRWVLDRGQVVESDGYGRPLRASGTHLEITERKRYEGELAKRNEFIESVLNQLPIGVFVVDVQTDVAVYLNHEYMQIFGWPEETLRDRESFYECVFPNPDYRAEIRQRITSDIKNSGSERLNWDGLKITTNDGQEKFVNFSCLILWTQQLAIYIVADVTDEVTAKNENEKLEEQLRQSQRIEAIGRLAGGIAHDFNNLLVAILGYSDLALRDLDENEPVRHQISEIKKAGDRAELLTRQLLAFSRKQVLQPILLNLNELIIDMDAMLQRLIGEDIELVTVPADSLAPIVADPGQLQQVIVNLAINSRDAMPKGGSLTLETQNVDFTHEYVTHHQSANPGPHVLLAVSDTGCGMDSNTLQNIFEPFYTTKDKGKGTGLGLSTVYGIVKQSGGNIWVYSEVGQGTTVKIYLPRAEGEAAPLVTKQVPRETRDGDETIIVVEDDEIVRDMILATFEGSRYSVIIASQGNDALEKMQQHLGAVHLLVTDVVMPGMSGRELARRVQLIYSDIKVLYISGYTENSIVQHGVLDTGLNFLQKPFTPDVLLKKVRDILDKSPS
ncbi:MAG: PAS domain S-box protein [Candidatus Hinthialibacter antarcticus]|nr:PAS domain S-box protein [Candidatus Hinthialibacter antarcticus]